MVSRKARDVIEPSRAFERQKNDVVWKYPETRERCLSQSDGRTEDSVVVTSGRARCVWRSNEQVTVAERAVCGEATNK